MSTKEQEKEVLKCIVSSDPTLRNAALKLIYKKCFPGIEKFVIKNKGSNFDAKDVFQDGVMILYQNIRNKKFQADSSLFTYLYSICRNVWLQRLRQNAMKISHSLDGYELNFEEAEVEQINIQVLKKVMSELKEECEKILIGFYYEMKTMKELGEMFNLGSEQAARNKKSRCLKHLTKQIRKKGLNYENFIV